MTDPSEKRNHTFRLAPTNVRMASPTAAVEISLIGACGCAGEKGGAPAAVTTQAEARRGRQW